MILTPLQKFPKNVEDLGKLIVAKGFKRLPNVQNIAQSSHTGCNRSSCGILTSICPLKGLKILLKVIWHFITQLAQGINFAFKIRHPKITFDMQS